MLIPFPVSTGSPIRYTNPTAHALFTLQYLQGLSDIPSFLPSTSASLGFFTCFSSTSPLSSSDAWKYWATAAMVSQPAHLNWVQLLLPSSLSLYPPRVQEKIPRCHPRERWIRQYPSLSSIIQISARRKFWRSTLIRDRKEDSHSCLLVTCKCFWKLLC